MIPPRTWLACLCGVAVFFSFWLAISYRSAIASWVSAAFVPPLIVLIWWMIDRNALERRIRRLEARSSISDERRVIAQTDLEEVEHRMHELEMRIANVENREIQSRGTISQTMR